MTCSFQREERDEGGDGDAQAEAADPKGLRLPPPRPARVGPDLDVGGPTRTHRTRGRDDPHPGDPNDDNDGTRAIVAAEAAGVARRTVADVKAGRCPAPRFVEATAGDGACSD